MMCVISDVKSKKVQTDRRYLPETKNFNNILHADLYLFEVCVHKVKRL